MERYRQRWHGWHSKKRGQYANLESSKPKNGSIGGKPMPPLKQPTHGIFEV